MLGGGEFVSLGTTFQADVVIVTEFLRLFQNPVVMHFAGSRFVAAGVIGQLQITKLFLLKSLPHVTTQIPFGDLHVIQIPVDFHVG